MSEQPADGTRWTRYIWLVYLGSLLFQPILDPTARPIDWVLTAALVAAFLPIYFATFRPHDQRRRLLLIGAMAGLAFVGSFVNGGASVFVVYAAVAAAWLKPVRLAVMVIAGLVGLIVLMVIVSPIPMPMRLYSFAPALIFTIVTGTASIFEAERHRATRRLLRADEEIERLATLGERERIARDLHDLLGHTLSVIVVKAELAGRLVGVEPDRAAGEIGDIERIGREALSEVRAAVQRLPGSGVGSGDRRCRAGTRRGRCCRHRRASGSAVARSGPRVRPGPRAARGGHQRRAACRRRAGHDRGVRTRSRRRAGGGR